MTGKSSLVRSPAAPDAALVHLSGSRRGATEFISGDHIVLSPAADGGIELSANDETPPHSLAVLECRGHTFGLTVTPGAEVWINGERLDELVLASGDVIEFGGGAVLRYRLYPPERRRYKTMADGGHIAPLATRGIVGQITATSVVYDANTTHGGSGGPVISLDGTVVAINAAIVTDFAGSNLGVPAAEALRLLASPPETT